MRSMSLMALVLVSTLAGATVSDEGQKIMTEFTNLRAQVLAMKPDGEVGGYLKSKSFGDHEVLWRLSDVEGEAEVIRIYREKRALKGSTTQDFVVAFHKGGHIEPGRVVIRRFYGPAQTGWRNDTVDVQTGEYLGRQGTTQPLLDERDMAIMAKWDLSVFY
jgi:hypothetical protein